MAKLLSITELEEDIKKLEKEINQKGKKLNQIRNSSLDYTILFNEITCLAEKRQRYLDILALMKLLKDKKSQCSSLQAEYKRFITVHRGTGDPIICNQVSTYENNITILQTEIAQLENQISILYYGQPEHSGFCF